MRQTLDAGLPELGLDLPESARQTLCDFGAAVIKQNEVMNLTAITQPDQVAKLHLLDSLTVLTAADLRGKQIIDVGCGAGFPGVPLAIACPEVSSEMKRACRVSLAPRNIMTSRQTATVPHTTPLRMLYLPRLSMMRMSSSERSLFIF